MNPERLHYFFNIKIIISNRLSLPIVKRFYDLMNFLVSDLKLHFKRVIAYELYFVTHKYSSSTISKRKESNEIYDKLSDHFVGIRTDCSGTIFDKAFCCRSILVNLERHA